MQIWHSVQSEGFNFSIFDPLPNFKYGNVLNCAARLRYLYASSSLNEIPNPGHEYHNLPIYLIQAVFCERLIKHFQPIVSIEEYHRTVIQNAGLV